MMIIEGIVVRKRLSLQTGCGDADYLFILFSLLLPIARDFHPDFIIVSAGKKVD